MNPDKNDLSLYLASSIHEIKNAFGRYQALTEDLLALIPEELRKPIEQQRIFFESKKISNQLTQVLVTYKNNEQGFQASLDDIIMEDYLEEFKNRHQPSLKIQNINFNIKCETDLIAYLDERLITNVIDTLIYNATQVGATDILFSAQSTQNFTELCVEDNGPGFPKSMLSDTHTLGNSNQITTGLTTDRTGLGLYFAENISKMHQINEKAGHLELGKSNQLKGARVTLFFPQ